MNRVFDSPGIGSAVTDSAGDMRLAAFDAGSFRDRSARVFAAEGKVFRALSAEGLSDWNRLQQTRFFPQAMRDGTIVRTAMVPVSNLPAAYDLGAGHVGAAVSDWDSDQVNDSGTGGFPAEDSIKWVAVLQHQVVPVVTYPYEWSFSMLRDAALLTLSLLQQAIAEDFILKDATPYNIQFIGTRPVFIDTSSFTPISPGQAWEGYQQFCQQFLFPLMLQAYRDVDFQPWLRGRLQGIAPQQMANLLSCRDLLRSGVVSHVWLHARLNQSNRSRSASSMQDGVARSLAESGFDKTTILNNVTGLQKLIAGLKWRATQSRWVDYDAASAPVHNDSQTKEKLVRQVVEARNWGQVWDIGCNMGRYSQIAAAKADMVLALDSDHLTIERLFQSLSMQSLGTKPAGSHESDVRQTFGNIVPLVFNLADPSTGLGWNGSERKALGDRSRPDLILCLAVIHHLVISENLLLDDVLRWLARMNSSVILEFVDRTDPQVQSLLINRSDQVLDYSRQNADRLIARYFQLQSSWELPSGTRTLFHLQPRRS